MEQTDHSRLPIELDDGLVLRWATTEDIEEVAAFNIAMHSDHPGEQEEWLGHWTRDLMNGGHPTTRAGDFTVVVDSTDSDRIVSTAALISQVWTYEGIPFGVGRPELIATHPDFRRRGLVRHQMHALHARSTVRGEMVNAITGIPWYYRQFGYEMALDSHSSRQLFWQRPTNQTRSSEEDFLHLCPATTEDISLLRECYDAVIVRGSIARPRYETLWRYELQGMNQESIWRLPAHVIERKDGEAIGYVTILPLKKMLNVSEVGLRPGKSWRETGLFLVRELKRLAHQLNNDRDETLEFVNFRLGESHPLYEAIDPELEKPMRPYAYYMRVAHLGAFLGRIAPALDRRMADSVMAGHSGSLRINLFHSQLLLSWEDGLLTNVGSYKPNTLEDGDVVFPDLTFLQLVFGRRDYDDLQQSYADCYASKGEAAVLLRILFPRRPSFVIPLA